jgi:predicted dinucleotide-utilizing enzyme
VEKEKYLKIAMENLSKVFSETGARGTIDVMAKLKLNAISDVKPDMIEDCNSILFERVKMLKGNAIAAQFLTSLKAACG